MFKNVASQKAIYFAFDATTNQPKVGDGANITPYVSKDYGTVTVLGSPTMTEMDATNAKGYYTAVLAQAETNADTLLFSGRSITPNIVVIGAPAAVTTVPVAQKAMYAGTVTSAPTTTGFVDSAQTAAANTLKGRVIIFYGAASIPQQAAVITANDGAGGYTFAAIPGAPSTSDTYVIV